MHANHRSRAVRFAAALFLAVLTQCVVPGERGLREGWTRIDAGVLSFAGPSDLRELPRGQATDSLGASYENARLSISFDYGWFSAPPSAADGAVVEVLQIDGKRAQFARYPSGRRAGLIQVYFETVYDSPSTTRCTFSFLPKKGAAALDENEVRAIAQSIVLGRSKPRRP